MVLTSIDPKIWGPPAWSLLHAITFHSNSTHASLKNFFTNLMHILPCNKCRESYKKHLEVLPFPDKSKSLQKWLYLIHNRVSSTLDVKDDDHPSYHAIVKKWSTDDAVLHAKSDGWTFLFLLVKVYPSKNNTDRFEEFTTSLQAFIDELCATILKIDPPNSAEINSRKQFKSWLEKTYRKVECCEDIPKRLLKPTLKTCSKICSIP